MNSQPLTQQSDWLLIMLQRLAPIFYLRTEKESAFVNFKTFTKQIVQATVIELGKKIPKFTRET